MRSIRWGRHIAVLSAVAILLLAFVGLTVVSADHLSGTTVFVDATNAIDDGGGCGVDVENACNTIQAGINHANPGGTVQVAAGIYTEQLTISASITLTGDPGDAAPGPGGSAPVLDGEGAVGSAITITGGVSGVIIEGFEIRNYASPGAPGGIGSAVLAWSATPISNVIVRDNYMHNLGWSAVLVGNEGQALHSAWTVSNNTITAWSCFAIELTNTDTSTVSGNVITGTVVTGVAASGCGAANSPQDGILIQSQQLAAGSGGTVSSVTVSNNTITGPLKRAGIELLAWDDTGLKTSMLSSIVVQNNTVNGAVRGVYIFSVGGNAGIVSSSIQQNTLDGNGDGVQIRSFGGGSLTSLLIEGNDILNSTGSSSGIHVREDTPAGGISVVFNTISGNTGFGVNHEGTEQLDATNNWWGTVNGPTHASNLFNAGTQGDTVSDNVDFVPWLDASSPDGGVSFAPVVSDTPPGKFASIQAAINAATGGTIQVVAGTYQETMSFPDGKDGLTVQGADRATTFVTGGIRFQNAGDLAGVTIRNFTVTGDSGYGTVSQSGAGYLLDLTFDASLFDGQDSVGFGLYLGKAAGTFTFTGNEVTGYTDWGNIYIGEVTRVAGPDGPSFTTVTFEDNYIHDNKGANVVYGNADNFTDQFVIRNNDFVDNGDPTSAGWASIEARNVDLVVSQDNAYIRQAGNTWGEGAGLYLENDGGSLINAQSIGDTFTDNFVGVYVFAGDASGITIRSGRFSGNGVAVLICATCGPVTGTIDATNNWWGCRRGPGNSGCDTVSGDINVSSPLTAEFSISVSTPGNVANHVASTGVTVTLENTVNATITVGGASATSGVAKTVPLSVGANNIAVLVQVIINGNVVDVEGTTITVTRATPPVIVVVPAYVPPPDADGDGIPDSQDACPLEVGSGDGCPAEEVVDSTLPEPVEVLNPESVETSVEEDVTVSTTSDDGSTLTVNVPAGALPEETTVNISAIADIDALVEQAPLPEGVEFALGFIVNATDNTGTAIEEEFEAPVTLEFTLDAASAPVEAEINKLVVAFWNGNEWIVVEATVTVNADGSITFIVQAEHFTLFAVLVQPDEPFRGQLPPPGGLTFQEWRGITGTTIAAAAALAGENLQVIWRFDVSSQQWLQYAPSAPSFVNDVFTLSMGDIVAARFR